MVEVQCPFFILFLTDGALMMHWWCTDDLLMIPTNEMHVTHVTNRQTDNEKKKKNATSRIRSTRLKSSLVWWSLMMHWWCTVECWCTDDALMNYWWYADDAVMMHWGCTYEYDALIMHWWWTDMVSSQRASQPVYITQGIKANIH